MNRMVRNAQIVLGLALFFAVTAAAAGSSQMQVYKGQKENLTYNNPFNPHLSKINYSN